MQLSVIIVNFNVKYFLEQCLLSVLKASQGLETEIIVIDNNSTDGSRGYLEPKFPGVKFIWNNINPGFGKANNEALKKAKGKYILFLNPDTIVPEDCFTSCISMFKTHPDCGALGVRMLDGSGRFLKESKRGLPSLGNSFYKMAGLAAVFPRSGLFAGYYAGQLKEDKTQVVDVLAGAFMMLSRKATDLTGGFDERFFMYAEDIDLSYRVTQAGLKNYYYPDISIIHFKGESTQRNSGEYVKHFYGAMKLFVKKHYPQKRLMPAMINIAIGAGKTMARLKQRIKPAENNKQENLNTAVVAGQSRFTNCVNMLKHAQPPVIVTGRISISKNDGAYAIGEIEDLKECIKKHKINLLVFCEGEISNKQIIELADQHAGQASYLFSGENSASLVGSNDKNSRGWFITRPA